MNSPHLLAQSIQFPDTSPDEIIPPLPDYPAPPTRIQPLIPEQVPPLENPETQPMSPWFIEQFIVQGSTVLSEGEWTTILQDLLNRPLSTLELKQAEQRITNWYTSNGYFTSGALIPQQPQYSEQNRTVIIQVIEGHLSEIRVQVQGKLKAEYVRSRLNLAATTPLHQETLLNGLKLLERDPNIAAIHAELSAGPNNGTNILDVEVNTTDDFRLTTSTNNSRSPSVGSVRRGVSINLNNLAGWGDILTAYYHNTDGSNSWDFGYSLPISPHNTTLTINLGTAKSHIIEQPFDRLDIRSKSHYIYFGIRHPLWQTPTEEFALGLQLSHARTQSTLFDIPFPLSPGADFEGRTRTTALHFSQEWFRQTQTSLFALRSQISFGIDAFDATINDTPPDSRFCYWQGQMQWIKLWGNKRLVVRGEVQLSDRPLLSSEQFGLGGQSTVRGYRQDTLLTDNGLLGMVELYIPVVKLPKDNITIQLIPFFNIGTGWHSGDTVQPEISTLISIGSGLEISFNDALKARLDWGIPLVKFEDTNETWQENGLYFQLLYNLY